MTDRGYLNKLRYEVFVPAAEQDLVEGGLYYSRKAAVDSARAFIQPDVHPSNGLGPDISCVR